MSLTAEDLLSQIVHQLEKDPTYTGEVTWDNRKFIVMDEGVYRAVQDYIAHLETREGGEPIEEETLH